MAELVYFTGPMDCGKSTLALQIAYTETEAGRSGRLFTEGDRTGLAMITSRIGLARAAVLVEESLDFWEYVVAELSAGQRLDFLVCDEAQFYTPGQIDQLARIADELGIEVFCFGILTDFRTAMFPASRRLVELCDRMEVLQVRPRCWCGAPATHNARTVDGVMVVEGDQVVVGDTGASNGVVSYQVLCRRHHRLRMTAQVAKADPTPDPLPFE
ncbi:MAG: thymidine kinase [Propionicimonas sp.]|uniref:thymidine kinase n=1 Tax=Propionicimonas sp. TaxID=1955623 RepID=UPI002B20675D|nr:thymidine kinase [Propionicimonas sp.]MEA4943661.1 thymidine kinase [Propionicimonas sp.]